jgi:hypothetical protein
MSDAPEPDDEAEARGQRAANAVVRFFSPVVRTVAMFISTILYVVMRLLPFVGLKFWERMTYWSLNKYHQRAGGDAVALVGKREATKAELEPIQWQEGTDDLEAEPGWALKSSDRKFKPSRHGDPTRVGRVPLVPINRGETRAGSTLECSVVEAIDQGRTRPLYRVGDDAELQARIEVDGHPGGETGVPVADGGADVMRTFEPGDSPIFEDMVVDLTPDGDYDGQALSFWTYADADPDKTTPEQLEQAKNRGLLAGMAGKNMQGMLIKLMLIAAAVALGGLIGPELVAALLGGGGSGGGGGIVPFSISTLAGL